VDPGAYRGLGHMKAVGGADEISGCDNGQKRSGEFRIQGPRSAVSRALYRYNRYHQPKFIVCQFITCTQVKRHVEHKLPFGDAAMTTALKGNPRFWLLVMLTIPIVLAVLAR